MQVLMSLRTNYHHYRQLTVNDMTEWEPFPDIDLGEIQYIKKCKITNIIIDDTGMFNGQVILSSFHLKFTCSCHDIAEKLLSRC